ncbi:MAG: hypothetical protein RIF33_02495 [Cyclobacteriaceae bacterium]
MKIKSLVFQSLAVLFLVTATNACKNREVHAVDEEEGGTETFKDMPVVGIESHFNRIVVDGVEYLILERDRNNPHEGFGFMAFRANKLLAKQDSILAYLQVQLDNQAEILSLLNETSVNQEKSLNSQKIKRVLEAKD